MNLSNNGLISIPIELSELENLKHLNLSENQGLSRIELKAIFDNAYFELKTLNLSGCDLLMVPESIGDQADLRSLNLSDNNLFSLPFSYSTLWQLRSVDLSKNRFYDLSWLIKYWWRLESINLLSNPEFNSGMLLLELSYLKSIKEVQIENLTSFPIDRPILINELTLRGSFISNFRLDEQKILINRLHFDNCQFDVDNYSESAVISKNFNYICFESINKEYLFKMNFLQADTLVFKNCDIDKMMFDNMNEQVDVIDLRSCAVNDVDRAYIAERNPHVNVIFEENVPQNTKIDPPFEQMVKKPEVKWVQSTDREVIVKFESVNLKVPADAFTDEKGRPYNGPVLLSTKSYTTPEEILFSGIPMTIEEEGESFMFSSAGMVEIKGQTPTGEPLILQKDVEVSMVSPTGDPNMNLYQLDDNGVWQEQGKDEILEPFKFDRRLLDSVANQDFSKMVSTNVIEVLPRIVPYIRQERNSSKTTFKIGFRLLPTRKAMNFEGSRQNFYAQYDLHDVRFLNKAQIQFYGDSTKYFKRFIKTMQKECLKTYKKLYSAFSKDYSLTGPYFIQNLTFTPDLERDVFRLSFSYKGQSINLPMVVKPRTNNIKAEVRQNRVFYERYKKAVRKRDQSRQKAYAKIRRDVAREVARLRRMEIEREQQRQLLRYENMELLKGKPDATSVVRTFTVSQFGIFNSDVKTRMTDPTPFNNKYDGENPKKIIVIDYDKNGVVQFENPKKAFFDAKAKTAIILFFTNTVIGIYQSWKHPGASDKIEVKKLDISNMSNDGLYNLVRS